MGWAEICTEDAVTRAERAVAALIGTFSGVNDEIFTVEFSTVMDELDWNSEELIHMITCITGLAALGIKAFASASMEPTDDDEETSERREARRAIEMRYLEELAGTLRMLRKAS